MLYFASNQRLSCADVDVYFRANAELREIDARLNREAGSCDDLALVVGLQVVHVRAGAVHFFANRMAGAMDEVFAEPLILDIASGGVIDIEAVNNFAGAQPLFGLAGRRDRGRRGQFRICFAERTAEWGRSIQSK